MVIDMRLNIEIMHGSWLMVIFGAVLHVVLVNGQAPDVMITMTDPTSYLERFIKATRDQDVIMDCYVQNLPQHTVVRWQRTYMTKNGTSKLLSLSQDMALEDNIHYSIERPTQFTWRLRIRSIQVTDEGTYQCFVLTNQDSREEDHRVISVVYRPFLDRQRTSPDTSVSVGETVDLVCNATARPPATIEWTRLGGALLPIGQEKKLGSELKIVDIQPKDRGVYRCTAINSVASTIANINVDVRFAPIVRVNRRVVYQAVGYRIELQCFGEGNPIPLERESYWTRGEEVRLSSSSDEYLEKFLQGAFGQVTYELIFRDVQESHYGTYMCNIFNAVGFGQTEITLAKTDEPQKSIKLGRIISAASAQSLSLLLFSAAALLPVISRTLLL